VAQCTLLCRSGQRLGIVAGPSIGSRWRILMQPPRLAAESGSDTSLNRIVGEPCDHHIGRRMSMSSTGRGRYFILGDCCGWCGQCRGYQLELIHLGAHAIERGVWAAAYRFLGALLDNRSAMLYSLSAMTTYGHANLYLKDRDLTAVTGVDGFDYGNSARREKQRLARNTALDLGFCFA
jgi:hypothetical protein